MHHFFVDPSSIEEGIVRIVGTDLNHMKNVLRMKPGEEVLISDGTGKDYNCQVKEYGAEEGILVILSENADSRELPSRIWLFQGLPKSDKMEVILQKCSSEAGCKEGRVEDPPLAGNRRKCGQTVQTQLYPSGGTCDELKRSIFLYRRAEI